MCRFCKKEGHYLKDYLKCKAWVSVFIYFVSNLVEVSNNESSQLVNKDF